MNDDFLVGALTILHYIYNTSGIGFANDIFPDAVDCYKMEKASVWADSPAHAIGFLDSANLKKLVQIASDRHHAAASDRVSRMR
jgi:hypothetical protein